MALPAGTIGMTHSSGSTRKSMITGLGVSRACRITGSNFLGLRSPEAHRPVGLGQFDKSGAPWGGAVAPFIKELLPLAHHAQVGVVQDGDFHRQFIFHYRDQFLDVHLDAAVAGDVDNRGPGFGHLHPHGRGEAVTHDPQAAGGHQPSGLIESIELGGTHLVLPHLRSDERVPLGQFPQFFHDVLGLDDRVAPGVGQRMFLFPAGHGFEPGPAGCGPSPFRASRAPDH